MIILQNERKLQPQVILSSNKYKVTNFRTFKTMLSLTGKFNFLASTGWWKGQANWCFHNAFRTNFCKNWIWLVTRPGRSGCGNTGGCTTPLTGSTWGSSRGGGSLTSIFPPVSCTKVTLTKCTQNTRTVQELPNHKANLFPHAATSLVRLGQSSPSSSKTYVLRIAHKFTLLVRRLKWPQGKYTASSCILPCKCYCPPATNCCMTQHKELPSAAAKIIQIPLYLCSPLC
jgi:hypothetical protein